MTRFALKGLGLVVAFGLLVVACKPKAGASCTKEGKEACQDKSNALVCHDGKFVVMACRGSTGCVAVGDSAACDNMNAEENDVCNLDGDLACAMDKKSFLQCAKKKWSVAGTCRGQNGCQVSTKNVKCDTSIAKVDDPCGREHDGEHACGDDHKTVLACKAGKYVLAGKCGGPKGCRAKPDEIDCDDSVGDIGDPCDRSEHYACAKDGRSLLVCKGSKFVKDEDCKKGRTCKIQGDKVGCS